MTLDPAVLESLFALAPVGLQIYQADGQSLLVNQAWVGLFGPAPQAGYNVLQDEAAAKSGVLDRVRRAFKGETIEVPPVWHDRRESAEGKNRRTGVQATFFPLFDRAGAVSHVAVLYRDVTARLVQREELEEERELLSAVVDQVGEGIVMADAAGVLRIVNRAARELGIRPGTTQEKWEELSDQRGPDGARLPPEGTPMARALRGETVRSIVQLRAPGGREHALATVSVPLLRSDGSLRGAVATFRDETERVRREREIQQAAHFRERFIGILGHDLRSPLTSILASAGLLLRQRHLEDPVLAAAARIASSAERMGRMIADLLDFTQARLGGGLSVVRKPCDLRVVVQSAVEEAQAVNAGRVIEVAVEGNTAGAFDPDRIAQLVSNLLANAIVYAPSSEPIRVGVRGIERQIEIAVENAGSEIPQVDRDSLFDPFRRGSVKGSTRGLGLGLFIVQQIARAHGGDVDVSSDPGRTVFRASFQR